MLSLQEFLARRKPFTNEYFSCPGSRKTVLISSYIWWTELMAYALLKLGYNVLVAEPWYGMWLDDSRWANFDALYRQWIDVIGRLKIQLLIGGNATLITPHPKTGELLHRAAGVPAVHYWWDEPRNLPPMCKRGRSAADHLAALKDERTLNVFWDIDVAEEMERFYGVSGIHVPLAATPEFWQQPDARPLAQRTTKLCFLGNNHDTGDWESACDPTVLAWARRVAARKLAALDRPMVQCVEEDGPYKLDPDLKAEFSRWNILGAVLLAEGRNRIVEAAARKLGDDFLLIGKGWERLDLKAQKEHSGVPGAGQFYANSQAALNLFGGCVHGGMPLRPYEIAASSGLLFTQYNRELPSLFEPGKECVAFRDVPEMLTQLDDVLASPSEHDAIVEAARRRVIAEHTWENRFESILAIAKERFDLPW